VLPIIEPLAGKNNSAALGPDLADASPQQRKPPASRGVKLAAEIVWKLQQR
jgi:hypothetical protein